MSKEQEMNGADAPSTGSKVKEKDNVNQFPDQDKAKHETTEGPHENRLLSFKEFVADKWNKFDTKTVEKDAMSGPKKGDAGIDTLENDYKQK